MAKESIATIGATYEFFDESETIEIISVIPVTASFKNIAGGFLMWYDGSTFTVIVTANGAGASIPSTPALGLWNGTATKTKEKLFDAVVCIKDDESDRIDATPRIPGNPPTDHPVNFKLRIKETGQNKVNTE